jgi:hypothetical protein
MAALTLSTRFSRRHEMIYRISPVFDIATCDRVVQLAEVLLLVLLYNLCTVIYVGEDGG